MHTRIEIDETLMHQFAIKINGKVRHMTKRRNTPYFAAYQFTDFFRFGEADLFGSGGFCCGFSINFLVSLHHKDHYFFFLSRKHERFNSL